MLVVKSSKISPKITQMVSDIKRLILLTEDVISESENEQVTEKALEQQVILDQLIQSCNELEKELKDARSEQDDR